MQTPTQTHQSSYLRKSHNNRGDSVEKHWIPIQVGCDRLERSVDLITEQASALFYNSEYKNCVEVLDELSQYLEWFQFLKKCHFRIMFFSSRIFKADPYHGPALVILIGCLIEMKEFSSRFSLCIIFEIVIYLYINWKFFRIVLHST